MVTVPEKCFRETTGIGRADGPPVDRARAVLFG